MNIKKYSREWLLEKENNGEEIRKNCIFFWDGIYSNWHKSPFNPSHFKKLISYKIDHEFDNNEQFFMYCKAKHFRDEETAKVILGTPNPATSKKLGRKVKGFNSEEWDRVKEIFMLDGLYCKFLSNKVLLDELLDTRDKFLVEASPFDKIWGIGIGESEARFRLVSEWKGENLLGKCLMETRESLRSK